MDRNTLLTMLEKYFLLKGVLISSSHDPEKGDVFHTTHMDAQTMHGAVSLFKMSEIECVISGSMFSQLVFSIPL